MKYTITVNQSALVESGLIYKTGWIDWCIIDYLKDFVIYRKSKRIVYNNEEYIWLNYNHLMYNMPCLKLNSKSSVSVRIKKPERLGLIRTIKAPDNTLYYNFTDKLIDICFCRKKDMERVRKEQSSCLCEGAKQPKQSPVVKIMATGDCRAIARNDINVVRMKSYPHFSDPVRAVRTAPVRLGRTAQYNTKISIKNKDNNKDISFSLKTEEIKPQINTDKSKLNTENTENTENKNSASSAGSAVKNVKGFSSFSGIWKVVDNIRQRGIQNENSKSKIPNPNDYGSHPY